MTTPHETYLAAYQGDEEPAATEVNTSPEHRLARALGRVARERREDRLSATDLDAELVRVLGHAAGS